MLFWGLTFVWFKTAVQYYEPITIIFIRLLIASSLLFAFALLTGRLEKVKRTDFTLFLLLALSQPFLYFLAESYGLKFVSSTISSAIIATIPLFSPFVALWFTGEKINGYTWPGIVVSFLGILIMLVNPDLSLNASLKGVLLLFGAVLAAVIYSVFVRKLAHKYTSLTIISYQNLLGAVYFLPLFLIFDFRGFVQVVPDADLMLSLLQLAIFGSCLAYIFFIMAIAKLGMVKANIFTNLIPVFTAIASYFILAEVFTLQKISGVLLVVLGIVVSQLKELMMLMKKQENRV